MDGAPIELEGLRPLSRSLLWGLVARYFREQGVQAWRGNEVPHYVTNNPVIAAAYAEIVFGALQDLRRLGRLSPGQRLHVLELGAGTGRFAFHFLRHWQVLCHRAGVDMRSVRYILSDQAQPNLDFWMAHPQLKRHFREGLLDAALVDVNDVSALRLARSGAAIEAGSLQAPLVVVANYLLDSIPQDLLYVDAPACSECQVALSVPQDPATMTAAALLETVQCHYERRPLAPQTYPEPWLARLARGYAAALRDTHLLFPAPALRCLDRLAALSQSGLVLLAADKGEHRLAQLQGRPPPQLVRHGSISMSVNFHAIKSFCEHRGGLALFPDAPHRSLDIGACLMVDDAAHWRHTREAYERQVADFSPDDFFTISKQALANANEMSVAELLAYLRLARYDGHQCARYAPRLLELASQFDAVDRAAVTQALDRVWEGYYAIGEEIDLADTIGRVFYRMGDYERALAYFTHSTRLYGEDAETAASMASCLGLLAR